jgi:hypothetical protein
MPAIYSVDTRSVGYNVECVISRRDPRTGRYVRITRETGRTRAQATYLALRQARIARRCGGLK